MSLTIRIIKANHGDSILVTNICKDKETRILIDGGPPFSFKPRTPTDFRDGELKRTLDQLIEKNKKIDLLVLTHVDDDHIGGLLKAFENPAYLPAITKKTIFNSGQLIYEHFEPTATSENDLAGEFDSTADTSIGQGISFEELISRMGVWDRKLITQGMIYSVDDLKLKILSPDKSNLKNLLGKWEKEQDSPFTATHTTDYNLSYSKLLENDRFKEDTSIHNGSTISFIIESKGRNFLFLGDAFPSTVVTGLKIFGYDKDAPLKAEFVKVSHHGSKSNTSNELLAVLSCPLFIISTDGSKHGLPNKKTLARIHSIHPNAAVGFNYGNLLEEIYTSEEISALGERLIKIDGDIDFG